MSAYMNGLRLLIAFGFSLSGIDWQVHAQEPSSSPKAMFAKAAIGAVIKHGCRQGECNAFRLDKRTLVRAIEDGGFYKLETTIWNYDESNSRARQQVGRTGGQKREEFVVCSLKSPSFIFPDEDGKWLQHTLTPASKDGFTGFLTGSYVSYFAACHGNINYNFNTALGRKLGYDASSRHAAQYELEAPEKALDPK